MSTLTYFSAPTDCPSCAHPIHRDGAYLVCRNQTCPGLVEGAINTWLSKLNVLGIGPGIVKALVSSGTVKTIADLYTLDAKAVGLLKMEGRQIGSSVGLKMVEAIEGTRRQPLDMIIGALNIPLIGRSMAKKAVDAGFDSLDKLMAASVADFERIPSFGTEKAQALFDGIRTRKDLIEAILVHVAVKQKSATGGPLSGKSVCFTGTAKNPRATLQGYVEEAGGDVHNTVKKDTTYLVAEDHGTTKAAKAKKYGTQLLTEAEFLQMVGKA